MLFGEFLLQRDAIDARQLLAALDEQQRHQTFLGALAVRENLMTVEQVLDVLNQQIDDRRSFGAVSLELKAIDEEGLDRLLALQRSTTRPLGEILVKQGALEPGQLRMLLDEFFALPE